MAIECVLTYLDWRHLGIVYPLLVVSLPKQSRLRLSATQLRRCIARSINQQLSSNRKSYRDEFQLHLVNFDKLQRHIECNPLVLLQHYFIYLRYGTVPNYTFDPALDYYYGIFSTHHVTSTDNMFRRVMSISFHPSECVVALVFAESICFSYGVFAYAGSARASAGSLLYYQIGPINSQRSVSPCACSPSHHFQQFTWSPKGTKICILETDIRLAESNKVNTLTGYFLIFDLYTYRIRKIAAERDSPDIKDLEMVTTWGKHINNMYLWATDEDIYYPEIWCGRTGFTIHHLKVVANTKTNDVTITRLRQIVYEPSIRPNLFVYPSGGTRPPSFDRCCVYGWSQIDSTSTPSSDLIPYSFWLINSGNVMFTSDECPNGKHIPHSILRRQAVTLPNDTFKSSSAIIFKHHKLHDAACLSDDPSYLLVLLGCDANLYTPYMTSARSEKRKWNGETYEPIDCESISYDLGFSPRATEDKCCWGVDRPSHYVRKPHQEFLYLGRIKGESGDDRYEHLAMAKVFVVDSPSHKPWQLQIVGQTKYYVLIRECCNRKLGNNNNAPPRTFLFSKLLNQCTELLTTNYYPHPQKDLFLFFDFNTDTCTKNSNIIVLKSRILSDQNDPDLDNDRCLAYAGPEELFSPCTYCKSHGYRFKYDFNKSIKAVRNDRT